jgi:hypothetical protein
MADLNVFQLTNQELRKDGSSKNETAKKSVKESVSRRSKKARKPFCIPAGKIKLESLKRFLEADDEDAEELDATADYTPDDDVVLVIDPDMEEVPEDTDEAIDAAEDLVGQHVCKCAICGANYVTDAEITEEVEIEDQECPVCGETGDQIVVGVITPTDELSDDDKEDIEDVDIDVDEEGFDNGEDVDVDFDEEETDDDFEEALKRSRRRTMSRRAESVRRSRPMRSGRKPSVVKESSSDYSFDEATFNRMLTRFAKENYSNVKSVRISKGIVRGSKLTLEGVVTTTKGSKRSIKFVAENFKPSARMSIKFKEYGPFTESVRNSGETFIVECVCRKNQIIPAALKYSFKARNASMRENKNMYSVTGRVLSESAQRRRK